MAQDNSYAFVKVQEDGTKIICIDCWFKAQPGHGMSFDRRPKPDREAMWVHCEMHHSRMGHTITNRGLAETTTVALVVGQFLGRENTTIPISGDYLIGLGVRSTTAAGLVGGSVATETITVAEVIDDCMYPQRTYNSEDEIDLPVTHETRSPTSKSLTKVRSKKSAMDNFFTLASTEEAENVKILLSCNGLLLCSGSGRLVFYYRIVLGEREEDSLLVINLSGKLAQYNIISKTLHDIFDCGSNQLDDNHDDDDDEHLQQLEAEHNVYKFILSFAIV
nr:hypothetical protein [Tanacetum cinerariifolium]